MTDARTLADEILKAAGSALKHYEPYSQDLIVDVAQRLLDEAATGAWSYDIASVPRGRMEARINAKGNAYQVYVQTSVWLAHEDGKVYLTYWVPKDPKEPSIGRWSGWCDGEEPVAWMPFAKPEHPGITIEAEG